MKHWLGYVGLCVGLVATPAIASSFGDAYFAKNFRSPTGNIVCQGDGVTSEDYPAKGVRCFVFEHTNTIKATQREKDCDLDWTAGFTILAKGRGKYEGVCHGDVFWKMDAPALNYGQTIKGNGWQCTSQQTGMTCTNHLGGGFFVSKSAQKVW